MTCLLFCYLLTYYQALLFYCQNNLAWTSKSHWVSTVPVGVKNQVFLPKQYFTQKMQWSSWAVFKTCSYNLSCTVRSTGIIYCVINRRNRRKICKSYKFMQLAQKTLFYTVKILYYSEYPLHLYFNSWRHDINDIPLKYFCCLLCNLFTNYKQNNFVLYTITIC